MFGLASLRFTPLFLVHAFLRHLRGGPSHIKPCMMRCLLVLLLIPLLAATTTLSSAADLSPKELVAQLYQAHRSKHDPLDETGLLGRYFDAALLKLYLKDKGEATGEVGRLDGDPLYNAQDIEIKDFSISAPGPSQSATEAGRSSFQKHG
jgi:hypothetical protein